MPKMIKIGEVRVLNHFDHPWNEPSHLILFLLFLLHIFYFDFAVGCLDQIQGPG